MYRCIYPITQTPLSFVILGCAPCCFKEALLFCAALTAWGLGSMGSFQLVLYVIPSALVLCAGKL